MRKIPLEKYKGKIKHLYFDEKLSLNKIAKEFGVSAGTVRKNMLIWEIGRRPSRKRELTKLSKKEIRKLYLNKKLYIEEIARKLNLSTSTIFRWLKNYKITATRRFKYKKNNFSKDLRERAYILGLVAGDIHARKHSRQILAELTTTHPAMINLFYSISQKYGMPKKYLKYNKKTGRYEWKIYILLDNSFDFMFSKDFNIDNEYFYNFLAGFFDCEGCLHIYNNHSYIGLSLLIYNSNKKLLEVIKRRLEKDGFHPKFSKFFKEGQKTTDNYFRGVDLWVLRMHTTKEILSLMSLMPIKHKEKLDRLKIAKSMEGNKWITITKRLNDLRKNIKEEVKEYTKPLNYELK